MMAVVVAAAAMSVAAAPLEYTGPVLHYHFTLPEGWVQIPADVVKQTMQNVTKDMRERRPEYTAGFQAAAEKFFTYPYMLVQEFPAENMALSDIATQMDNLQKKSLQTLTTDEALKNIGMGQSTIDTRRNMVLVNMRLDVKDVGPLKALTVSCPGRKGVAQLHFYARENDYATYAPVFEQILDSFAFEKGYEYRKPLIAERAWFAAGVIAGAVVIPALFIAAKRKRKAGGGGQR